MKKMICSILAVMILVGSANCVHACPLVGIGNFEKGLYYHQNTFCDITSTQWYYSNVVSVYEYGLMNGKENNKFDPSGKLTIAETITIASRIYSIYFNNHLPEFSTEMQNWYSGYVELALYSGIIAADYPDYNAPATRAEFAKILAESIDPVDLEEINIVDEGAIPDVAMNSDYAEAVYLLYRAGVLTGADDVGSFRPMSTISRAEAAAIITRIVDPSLRQSIELVGEY